MLIVLTKACIYHIIEMSCLNSLYISGMAVISVRKGNGLNEVNSLFVQEFISQCL